jgi:hypothetical protein
MTRIISVVTTAICLGAVVVQAQESLAPTYTHLKDLEYFAGDWEVTGPMVTGDKREELSVITSYRWLQNKAFMLVTLQDTRTKEMPYVAVLGWDPDKKHVMSWDFNLLGTIFNYYQGKDEKGWWVKGTGRMPDGATIEFSGLYTLLDDTTTDYKGSGTITKDGKKTPVTLELKGKKIRR